jgi:TrmH family RNA methyltransferase
MGAIFRTNVEYCDLAEKLYNLSKEGFSIYGAMLDGESIYKAEKKSPSVLVIGNEGHGISEKISSKIERRLTIPNIGGTCESLNAAVATAILVSEFYR